MAAGLLDASLISLALVVTVADLRSRLIPDVPLIVALSVALAVCAICDPGSIGARLLAGGAAAGFLLGGALIRPDGMGLGDVKLAGVLGVHLGARVLEAMAIAFGAGSLAGVVLLLRHGWAGRRRTIPFGPFLALGALLALAPQP
jgi:leader peptidase (prepilin peptidase)/N-methyltransferase